MTRTVLALALAAVASALMLAAVSPARAQEAAKPGGIHYLYLIRHGMYDYDSTVTDDAVGHGLNRLGHEQAALVGRRIASLPVKPRALVTSNYLRAVETAGDMAPLLGLKPVVDTLIHECTPRFESRPEYRPLGTEAEALACEANLEAAYAKYVSPTPAADTHDVLVCHGNVIRWLVCKAIGLDVLNWRRMTIGNCSITALAVSPDGMVRLAAYSDTGHIPLEQQTWTGRGAGWLMPPAARPAR